MQLHFSEEAEGDGVNQQPCPAKFSIRAPRDLRCYKKEDILMQESYIIALEALVSHWLLI
jgi:hypothetical protein